MFIQEGSVLTESKNINFKIYIDFRPRDDDSINPVTKGARSVSYFLNLY